MKKINIVLFSLMVLFLMPLQQVGAQESVPEVQAYDTARIFEAMAKARRGEDIVIGVIGGSITQGYAASSENTRWANLMTNWWKTTFPTSNITLVNAGIGGTGSDIGVHRVQNDLLKYNPDFIMVEFSVNDAEGDMAKKMMEGLMQQILSDTNSPGVMMLILKMENGTTAQASHKPVANHYGVPMVSFADLIDQAVADDGKTLHECFIDGLHPVDLGMQYIAEFITDELNKIYSVLPADEALPAVNKTLPEPLVGTTYSHTYMYNANTLVPLSNVGWNVVGTSWVSETPNSELIYEIDGNAISFLFSRFNTTNRGMAEVWIDNGSPIKFDGYFSENWGPATVFGFVNEGLSDGVHTLHIRVLDEHNAGSTGNYFQVLNVLKAGNIGTAAPIAKLADSKKKALTNSSISLNASQSYDPDGEIIDGYEWGVYEKPNGADPEITDPTAAETNFTSVVEGYYKVGMVVNAGGLNSVPSHCNIHLVSSNQIPVANAGTNQKVATKKGLTLTGGTGSDADNDSLQYLWTLVSKPEGSKSLLQKVTTPEPYIKPDIDGDYVIGLTVNDSIDNSALDTMIITAITNYVSDIREIDFFGETKIYPNPVKNILNISYILNESSETTIQLISVDGRENYPLLNKIQSVGEYQLSFDLKNYNCKGNYMLKISNGSVFQVFHLAIY